MYTSMTYINIEVYMIMYIVYIYYLYLYIYVFMSRTVVIQGSFEAKNNEITLHYNILNNSRTIAMY